MGKILLFITVILLPPSTYSQLVKPFKPITFKEETFCQPVNEEIKQRFSIDTLTIRLDLTKRKIELLKEMKRQCSTTLDSCNFYYYKAQKDNDIKDSINNIIIENKNRQIKKQKIEKNVYKTLTGITTSIIITLILIKQLN